MGVRYRKINRTGDEDSFSNDSSMDTVKMAECRSKTLKVLLIVLLILVLIFTAVFVVIPLVFRTSIALQSAILFMNYVNLQAFYDVKNVSHYGLNCTNSFYIHSDEEIKLGLWHLRPDNCGAELDSLTNQSRVVLYAHGNGGTRGGFHRIGLYKKLTNEFGFHVIAFDYRGYGDSSNVRPTMPGVVSDTHNVYRWIRAQGVLAKNILLWGHSLGTGISARFISSQKESDIPAGTVLEAPFTSLQDTIKYYPLAKFVNWLPWFESCFIDPIVNSPDLNLNTVDTLNNIYTPLLILHAEDDGIVPYKLGEKLFRDALTMQPKDVQRAQYFQFNAQEGLGHKMIFKSPEFTQVVGKFLDSIRIR